MAILKITAMPQLCCQNTAMICRHLGIEGASTIEVILLTIFCLDILVSFFVGYYDESGLLVMDNAAVALHYLRWVSKAASTCIARDEGGRQGERMGPTELGAGDGE